MSKCFTRIENYYTIGSLLDYWTILLTVQHLCIFYVAPRRLINHFFEIKMVNLNFGDEPLNAGGFGAANGAIQGYLVYKKPPPPPGPPQDSRHSPTVGSQVGAVSSERGTPVHLSGLRI